MDSATRSFIRVNRRDTPVTRYTAPVSTDYPVSSRDKARFWSDAPPVQSTGRISKTVFRRPFRKLDTDSRHSFGSDDEDDLELLADVALDVAFKVDDDTGYDPLQNSHRDLAATRAEAIDDEYIEIAAENSLSRDLPVVAFSRRSVLGRRFFVGEAKRTPVRVPHQGVDAIDYDVARIQVTLSRWMEPDEDQPHFEESPVSNGSLATLGQSGGRCHTMQSRRTARFAWTTRMPMLFGFVWSTKIILVALVSYYFLVVPTQ